MTISLNGERYELERPDDGDRAARPARDRRRRVAVEHNLVVLKRAAFDDDDASRGRPGRDRQLRRRRCRLTDDRATQTSAREPQTDTSWILHIADKTFTSRLIVGTGKYSSPAVMVKAHEASGAEMVTVAVRRVNIFGPQRRKACSTTSTRRSTSCCRTPPAATPPTTPSAPRGSDARRGSRTG